MPALWRQLWILTYKNLLITLRCHGLTTPLRAIFLPIAITLFLYALRSPQNRRGLTFLGLMPNHSSFPRQNLAFQSQRQSQAHLELLFVSQEDAKEFSSSIAVVREMSPTSLKVLVQTRKTLESLSRLYLPGMSLAHNATVLPGAHPTALRLLYPTHLRQTVMEDSGTIQHELTGRPTPMLILRRAPITLKYTPCLFSMRLILALSRLCHGPMPRHRR